MGVEVSHPECHDTTRRGVRRRRRRRRRGEKDERTGRKEEGMQTVVYDGKGDKEREREREKTGCYFSF